MFGKMLATMFLLIIGLPVILLIFGIVPIIGPIFGFCCWCALLAKVWERKEYVIRLK